MSERELPAFSCTLNEEPSRFLLRDNATFNSFAVKVLHHVKSLLSSNDIHDKATLRNLYALKLNLEILNGENEAGLQTSEKLAELQSDLRARATTGILDRPLLKARISSRAESGPVFEKAFKTELMASLNALDWMLAAETVKSMKRSFEVATPGLLAESERSGLDPAVFPSNSVNLSVAETMIEDRIFVAAIYPLKARALPILTAYVTAHSAATSAVHPNK